VERTKRNVGNASGNAVRSYEPQSPKTPTTRSAPNPTAAHDGPQPRHADGAAVPSRRGAAEWHDEDLVFAQANGRPIDKKTEYDDWTRLLESAGVRHVRLHDGRHTAATLLLSENVHPRVVMELLGHSQMRTTVDIYSHVMPALAREAADRMGTILLTK